MDRFVWFVLLVVMSHLVTEFTRVTGFTRGSRQDVVMVNDSSIQPIRVQNLVLYPGQEYGHYEQQNQQYYNGNNPYNNYANNNNNNNNQQQSNSNNLSNFFSSLFNPSNSNNNNNNAQQQQQFSGNIANQNEQQQGGSVAGAVDGDVRTFSFRPLIDSIFEIPISTLRAVNNMVGRLTGGYQQLDQQQQTQQQLLPQNQQQSPQFPSSLFSYFGGSNSGGSGGSNGMQKSAGTIQPKTEFEMLNRIRQSTQNKQQQQYQQQKQVGAVARAATVATVRKPLINGFQTIPSSPSSSISVATTSRENSKKSWLNQQSS